MKKQRIILAIVAAIVALALCASVSYYWKQQGCGFYSLCAGCAYYIAIVAALWNCIDHHFTEE